MSVCVGCGHPRANHYYDVDGISRCTVTVRELALNGNGPCLLYEDPCDCVDFVSTRAHERSRADHAVDRGHTVLGQVDAVLQEVRHRLAREFERRPEIR